MSDLAAVFDATEMVVRTALEQGHATEEAHSALDDLRNRLAYHGRTFVVALAGGTGSGKSSLLNAIAGERIASVSRLRPHTEEPLAWIPVEADAAVDALLDALDITRTVRQQTLPGLAIIDLPDMDSMQYSHRKVVEQLLPKVDALVWVLDPQKYRDGSIHNEFLARLTHYAPQTIVVLNKIDMIPHDDRAPLLADVERSLNESGYENRVAIHAVAAAPENGTMIGIGPLVRLLTEELDHRRSARGKLLADLGALIKSIGVEAGLWTGGLLDFDMRWAEARRTAAEALNADPAKPDLAAQALDAIVVAVTQAIGGDAGVSIRDDFSLELIRGACGQVEHADLTEEEIEARLDEIVGRQLRKRIYKRGALSAAIVDAHLAVRKVAHEEGLMAW